MISLHNVSLSFGQSVIFDDVSLKINPGQCVGVCAPNGTGKTTLLGCLAGEVETHSGSIQRPAQLKLGYFHQQGVDLGNRSVRKELEEAYEEYFELEKQITQLEEQITRLSVTAHHSAGKENHQQKMNLLGHAIDELEQLHRWQAEMSYEHREAEMAYMLKGLGFQPGDLDRLGCEFSGGWQMKVGLAKVLLAKPDLLMLDEPTNHLDLAARMWLIEILNKLSCTQIIVSHDRYFLDHTISVVAELWDGKINLYSGNYSQYEVAREKQMVAQEKQRLGHQRFLKKEEAFIERFRYKASKARQVQSRIKLLEKMAEPGAGSPEPGQVRLKWNCPSGKEVSGEQVLEVENISKSYGGTLVFEDAYFSLGRGEKVALLGPNGAGKSSLLRIIAGRDKNYSGKLHWGTRVQLTYFSQRAADLLDENQTVWDYITSINSEINELSRRKTLGMFLFQGDDISQLIGSLSGGEKARVLLCSLVLQPCNFLVLDEPTNHLDLDTQQVLLEALQDFPGVVLFSSHDRYLLEQLAEKIVLLDCENQVAHTKIYYGDYAYYLWKREEEQILAKQLLEKQLISGQTGKVEPSDLIKNNKEARALKRKLEKEEEKLLQKIDGLEAERIQIHADYATVEVYTDPQRLRKQGEQLKETELQLEQCHQHWEEIQKKLEGFSPP